MVDFQRLASRTVFPLMIVISLVVGRLIPAYYDWTGADQSRPSPLIPRTALGLLLFGVLVCLPLPWLRLGVDPPAKEDVGSTQVRIRAILIMTAVIALLLVAFRNMPSLVVSVSLQMIVLGYIAWFWVRSRPHRWPVATLLACMYLPFAWIVTWGDFGLDLPAMLEVCGLPAFFFTLLLGRLVQQHSEKLGWLSVLLTGAELLLGVWMIRLGPRRTVAYLVFVLIASIFGSFTLNMLVRV